MATLGPFEMISVVECAGGDLYVCQSVRVDPTNKFRVVLYGVGDLTGVYLSSDKINAYDTSDNLIQTLPVLAGGIEYFDFITSDTICGATIDTPDGITNLIFGDGSVIGAVQDMGKFEITDSIGNVKTTKILPAWCASAARTYTYKLF